MQAIRRTLFSEASGGEDIEMLVKSTSRDREVWPKQTTGISGWWQPNPPSLLTGSIAEAASAENPHAQ